MALVTLVTAGSGAAGSAARAGGQAQTAPRPARATNRVLHLTLIDRQVAIVQGHGEKRGGRRKRLPELSFPAAIGILAWSQRADVLPIPSLPGLRRGVKEGLGAVIEVILLVIIVPRRLLQKSERRLKAVRVLLLGQGQDRQPMAVRAALGEEADV